MLTKFFEKLKDDFNSCNVARFIFWSFIGFLMCMCIVIGYAVKSHAQVPAVNSGTFAYPTSGAMPSSPLTGTTASLGGSLLAAGGCTSGTVNVTGAAVGMGVLVTPNTYPGDGTDWKAYVSSANTITVKICGLILITPTATTYYVKVW